MTARPYVPRLAEARLEQLLTGLPALSIVGPRATGKTTIARRLSRSVVALDLPQPDRQPKPDRATTSSTPAISHITGSSAALAPSRLI
jgi:uncharacterized protein